jgi:dipeptidyl aminopeptidase/acylaminoacyl peptidase
VLSHGTPSGKEAREAMTDRYGPQASALAELGYVVVTGLRRGYGASDGPLADRYGSCDAPDYAHAARRPRAMWRPS